MSKCHVCGASQSRRETVSEVFLVKGRRVLVEGISARVCVRCGDASFSRATTERVRRLVHGDRKSARKIEMDVLAVS